MTESMPYEGAVGQATTHSAWNSSPMLKLVWRGDPLCGATFGCSAGWGGGGCDRGGLVEGADRVGEDAGGLRVAPSAGEYVGEVCPILGSAGEQRLCRELGGGRPSVELNRPAIPGGS